jgi:lipopolysaccharide/colanic/teichoic acid biosynthesis glycosyltransferase
MHDQTPHRTTTDVGPVADGGRRSNLHPHHPGGAQEPPAGVAGARAGATSNGAPGAYAIQDAVLDAVAARLRARRPGAYERVVKVAVDRNVALVGLLLVCPLLLVVAVLVLVSMGRPVLYRQARAGRDGRPFTMWKFRTMRADRRYRRERRGRQRRAANRGDVRRRSDRRVTHKTGADPRHTRVGRVLRRTSLDELPQLWNVLRGDMSLIGPRPELYELAERFVGWQRARHLVRPGITGLWQTTERGHGRLLHECVDLDLRTSSSCRR